MLAESTLVLNRSWRVVNVTTVKKALMLLYEGAAVAVSPETYQTYDFIAWLTMPVEDGQPCIRTMRFSIKLPEIIQLTRYNGFPPKGVAFSRKNVYKRDNYTCQYCGMKPSQEDLTVDHVMPRSRGGHSEWANCVSACSKCNKKKGNKTTEEAGMKLLQKPYKPEGNRLLMFAAVQIKKSWERFVVEAVTTVSRVEKANL